MTATTAGGSAIPIYFNCFMFTANLRPDDRDCTKIIVRNIRKLRAVGYDGFDLQIAPGCNVCVGRSQTTAATTPSSDARNKEAYCDWPSSC